MICVGHNHGTTATYDSFTYYMNITKTQLCMCILLKISYHGKIQSSIF